MRDLVRWDGFQNKPQVGGSVGQMVQPEFIDRKVFARWIERGIDGEHFAKFAICFFDLARFGERNAEQVQGLEISWKALQFFVESLDGGWKIVVGNVIDGAVIGIVPAVSRAQDWRHQ